jgi:hypothetical protein
MPKKELLWKKIRNIDAKIIKHRGSCCHFRNETSNYRGYYLELIRMPF